MSGSLPIAKKTPNAKTPVCRRGFSIPRFALSRYFLDCTLYPQLNSEFSGLEVDIGRLQFRSESQKLWPKSILALVF